MKHGFVKVACASPKIKMADTAYNAKRIMEIMESTHKNGAELLVLSELCLTGCSLGDLFFDKNLLDSALKALKDIAQFSKGKKLLTFAGLPVEIENRIYDVAAAIHDGNILAFIPKTNLKSFNGIDLSRQFTKAPDTVLTIDFFGEEVPFGTDIIFCDQNEPALTIAVEIGYDLFQAIPPSTFHSKFAGIIVNLCADGEVVGSYDYRELLVKAQSAKTASGYVLSCTGAGESCVENVFSAQSIIAESGTILAQSQPFDFDALTISEIDVQKLAFERSRRFGNEDNIDSIGDYLNIPVSIMSENQNLTRQIPALPFISKDEAQMAKRSETVMTILAQALKAQLDNININKIVIGLSGGLDSALTLLAAVRATNAENIIAVTMPGFGTTTRTLQNSKKLASSLNIKLKIVDIKKTTASHLKDISHDMKPDITYENAQARMRTMVLFNLANSMGAIVAGTGDLSEAALGWSTFNGDHMSSYNTNGNVPKTLIRALIAYEAKRLKGNVQKVLEDILNTIVSPELLPPDSKGDIVQNTEAIIGDYDLHDFFLFNFLRNGADKQKLSYLAAIAFKDKYSQKHIDKVLDIFFKRFFKSQFKRTTAPPSPKIGTVGLTTSQFKIPSDL